MILDWFKFTTPLPTNHSSRSRTIVIMLTTCLFSSQKTTALNTMCVTKISLTNNKRLFYLSIVPSLVIHSMISFSEGMTKSLASGWDPKEAHTSMGRGGCIQRISSIYIQNKARVLSIQPHTPHHNQPQSNLIFNSLRSIEEVDLPKWQ